MPHNHDTPLYKQNLVSYTLGKFYLAHIYQRLEESKAAEQFLEISK